MRDEADFSAYAVARWPSLVRVAVLLDSPAGEAHDLARTVLARLRSDWRRRDELGDLDEHTAATLLECRARPDGRAGLVLQALLDVAGPFPEADLEAVRRDAGTVLVEPLQLEQVVLLDEQQRRARRRRTARLTTVVVAMLAVVVGGWTWWATRPDPPPGLPDAHVERVDNPVRVGWYTDHTLRLDRVALTIDDLRSFEQISQGAVYADSRGEIVLVELDGTRTRLGTQAPDGAFAASDADGLVAWVDVSDEPELRIYDLAEREVVSSESIGETARVLAMDRRMAFVHDLGESYIWEWLPDWKAMSRTTGPGPVLDAAGGAVAYQQHPQTLLVSHGRSTQELAIPGTGAHLAPEGDYVLTSGEPRGRLRIYETIQGQEIDTGLSPRAEVYAAKLGGRGVATYLVGLEQDDPDDGPRVSSSGSLQLVTCPLLDPGFLTTCTVHRTFPRDTAWALAQ